MPRLPRYLYDYCSSEPDSHIDDTKLKLLEKKLLTKINEVAAKAEENQIFVCTWNETTYNEITEAIKNHQLPICYRGRKCYIFVTADWKDEEMSKCYWFKSNYVNQSHNIDELTEVPKQQYIRIDKANNWKYMDIAISGGSASAPVFTESIEVNRDELELPENIAKGTPIESVIKQMVHKDDKPQPVPPPVQQLKLFVYTAEEDPDEEDR